MHGRQRVHLRREAPRSFRHAAIIEVAAFTGLLLSYIWVWKGTFRGNVPLVLALYFGIGLEAHLRRREGLRHIGLSLANFGSAARLALIWVGPIVAVIAMAGLILGTWHLPSRPLMSAVWHLSWGTIQQYGLLAVLFRRLEEIFPAEGAAELTTGLMFGVFHFPNPFLAPAAVSFGILAAWLYRREPNLYVMGLCHAAVGFALTHALPVSLTWGMRVGPAVFRM